MSRLTRIKKGIFEAGALLLGFVSVAYFLIAAFSWLKPDNRKEYETDLFETVGDHQLHATLHGPTDLDPEQPVELDSIEITWPKEMEINNSGSVILVIQPRPKTPMVDNLGSRAQSLPASTPSSSTPASGPSSTNRPGYRSATTSGLSVPTPKRDNVTSRLEEVYLRPKLAANNFTVTLNTPETQLLGSSKVEWRWNISPKQIGSQVINSSLGVHFIGLSSRREDSIYVESRTATIWLEELQINIYKNWFTKDSFSIGSLIAGIVGTGLSVPWLYDRLKERHEKKKRNSVKIIGFIRNEDEERSGRPQ